MFVQTTGVTNALMIVCIFLNIEHLHAMLCQLESAAFQPKSQKEYLVACLKERIQRTAEKKCLVECIERYLEIIMFTERLQHICRIGLSIVFVSGVINICTTLSLLLVVRLMELVWLVIYLSEMVMIIYVHCFYGSILASESEDIPYALFSSKWVGTDVAHKKIVAIFMIFSKKQLYIKLAGGTLTMTLPLFVQVCQDLVQYFNFLY
nr:unnamed protein product [Callosobruchus chinensis]